MTVGEKIQFYRRKSGISQEELGQRLFVSRQTVSLWEMDKTLPTIDNLNRLKDIFGVSIDEILNQAQPVDEEKPNEVCEFTFTETELRDTFKKTMMPFFKRLLIVLACWIILMTFFAITSAPDGLIGIFVGIFVITLIFFGKGYFSNRNAWRSSEKAMLVRTYNYEVYNDHLILKITQASEIVSTFRIAFDEIEKIQPLGNFLQLYYAGKYFLIKREALKKDSFFLRNIKPENEQMEPASKLKRVSNILVICSIMALFGAIALASILTSAYNNELPENMWVFFLFALIPLCSLIFGIWGSLKKSNGYNPKNNIIVGIIMTIFLCIYGSFTFIFGNQYSHDDGPIVNVEQILNIDIPEHKQINTRDWTMYSQSKDRGYVFYTSDIYFDEDAVKNFELGLEENKKWISSLPSNLVGITLSTIDSEYYDYILIYNTQTKEYNSLPHMSGKYKFISVFYNSKTNKMTLIEYEIEYTK